MLLKELEEQEETIKAQIGEEEFKKWLVSLK